MFNQKTIGFRLFFISFFIIMSIFIFFPQFWMINTALKESSKIFSTFWFFEAFALENVKTVITDARMLTYLRNSFVVAFTNSVLTTLVTTFCAYSFSKYRYRFRKPFLALIMVSQAFPSTVLLLSIYTLMQRLGLLDNYLSLVLSYITFSLPVGVFTLKAFFDQIPDSIIESGKIDGANTSTIIFRIIFPIATPGIVSVAINAFVWGWNDLIYSLTLITTTSKRTLAPGLILTYLGEFQNNWGTMMAASIIVSVPVAILFLFLQRYFVAGLIAGSVKE